MNYSKQCPACRGMGAVPNAHTGSSDVCPVCEGSGETEPKVQRWPYDFVVPRQVIAANAQISVGIQTPAQFDLEWWDTVAEYTGPLDVVLEVNSDTLMNRNAPGGGNINGIDIRLWAGNAQLPYARRYPWILPRQTQLLFTLTDTSGAQNTVQIALKGFQLKGA